MISVDLIISLSMEKKFSACLSVRAIVIKIKIGYSEINWYIQIFINTLLRKCDLDIKKCECTIE